MDLQHIINCLSALHLNIDKKNEASFEIEEILKMLIQYKKDQALQLQQTGVSSSFKTKEYPDGSEIVINQISVNYSQVNEEETDIDDNLKLSICHQGAGFYFVLESKRWAFNNIDELVKILYDFQSKAKVE